jgi:cell division protein FtsQ
VRPLTSFRDPAPSRLAYRVNRWLLTPMFRQFLFIGLPVALVTGMMTAWLGDPARRAAIADGFAEMRRSVEQRPEFMVKMMAIDGATDDVAQHIREIVPVDFPISSFELDLAAVRGQIRTLDAVAQVDVRVRSGGVLQVDVVERVPAVVWRAPEGLALLDLDGRRVAALAARMDRADLPLVAGTGADRAVPEALRLIAAAGPVKDRLRGLLRVGERRWDVVLDRDQRILLPELGAVEALEQVLALDEARDLLGRNVTVVDMRLPHRPTLRLAAHAVEELRRVRSPVPGAD